MITDPAVVQTLIAEVRVLALGNRQITTGVARQLDEVEPERIEPFGRVEGKAIGGVSPRFRVYVVGRDVSTGALVRSNAHAGLQSETYAAWKALPLIVLASR